MTQQVRVAPPNSVILVMDAAGGAIPRTMGSSVVAATESCVAIGTLAEADGETLISVSEEEQAGSATGYLAFDGRIVTPSATLTVTTVLGDVLLALSVRNNIVRLRIWVNDRLEPNDILISIST